MSWTEGDGYDTNINSASDIYNEYVAANESIFAREVWAPGDAGESQQLAINAGQQSAILNGYDLLNAVEACMEISHDMTLPSRSNLTIRIDL